MRVIAILTLISLTCICVFWYTEVATPYQQEYTQDKAKALGGTVVDKGSELGRKALETGEDIYDDRQIYFDKAKELGQKTLEASSQLKHKGSEFLEENAPLLENAKDSAGNLLNQLKGKLQ